MLVGRAGHLDSAPSDDLSGNPPKPHKSLVLSPLLLAAAAAAAGAAAAVAAAEVVVSYEEPREPGRRRR